jgi:hypothetical protein
MRFFGWLVLHQKTLTAQNLLWRHWPCNWICCLCTCAFEDTNHLFSECVFTRQTWSLICQFQNLTPLTSSHSPDVETWWNGTNHVGSKVQMQVIRGSLLTTWWNIWLERNRRIFQNSCLSVNEVAHLIKQDLDLRKLAFKPPWFILLPKLYFTSVIVPVNSLLGFGLFPNLNSGRTPAVVLLKKNPVFPRGNQSDRSGSRGQIGSCLSVRPGTG